MKYSEKILAHFFQPKNVGLFLSEEEGIGRAIVGSYENGALIHFQLKIKNGLVVAAKFKAYGTCTIIAACSYTTQWVKCKTIEEAMQLTSREIIQELAIPETKVYSALLVEDALKTAIRSYNTIKRETYGN
jgi:nitrogen fixation NifU-like protein